MPPVVLLMEILRNSQRKKMKLVRPYRLMPLQNMSTNYMQQFLKVILT